MTLWFVFALMTVAAIFAVLWPLGRGAAVESRRQRGDRLQGSTRRDRPRRRRGPDRRFRSGGRARRNRPPPAGGGGSASAIRRRSRISGLRRSAAVLALVGLPLVAVAFYLALGSPQLGDFPLARAHHAPPTPTSRSTIWWRRSRRIWKRTRPMAAAGACWRRCWRGSAATTTRSAPIAIRSPITATAPSAAPISAKRLRARPAAS